ncbi:hypothetical protein AB2M62_12155 [Sphingomonas sp. MMS12-HWE2-04]|uniref:hypothetical protein n=1 Tax=Sphingomonas sp. MMS12-HWE2-04 TaxID=3234199 RepID=UPI00384AB89E
MIALLAFLPIPPASQSAETTGPGTLCLKYSSFALAPGERVTKRDLGIESMQLEIDGPHGRYTITESELMGGPNDRDRLIETRQDAKIYARGHSAYAFRAKLAFSLHGAALAEPTDQFYVSIRGSGLDREPGARQILSRAKLGTPAAENCIMRYHYGWEFFLPAESE